MYPHCVKSRRKNVVSSGKGLQRNALELHAQIARCSQVSATRAVWAVVLQKNSRKPASWQASEEPQVQCPATGAFASVTIKTSPFNSARSCGVNARTKNTPSQT